MDGTERTTGGVQSLDGALMLLRALRTAGGPVALKDLAAACAMPPSKAHRYLASFQAAGFVRQTGPSGKYDLGPEALELGLSAIGRHDFVNRTSDGLADLAAETGMSVLLSVWGTEGATVVRWERAETPTVTSMGLGTTLPLLNSATGRAFLAWAPPAAVQVRRTAELRRARKTPALLPDCDANTLALDEMAGLSIEVREYEPETALTDGADGLEAYRAISRGVMAYLVPGGRILVEIGPTQGTEVADLFLSAGLVDVRIVPDLDGRDRVVCAKRPD